MKKLVVVLLLVLAPLCGFAQTGRIITHSEQLINRVDEQKGNTLSLSQPTFTRTFRNTNPIFHQVTPQAEKSFSISWAESNRVVFDAGSLGIILGTIQNLTIAPVRIKFIRNHVRILPKWTSSICFGVNCYSPKTDSIDDDAAYEIAPNGDPGEFRLNIECPSTASDSSIDFVQLIGIGTNDTISFTLVGVASPKAGVTDIQPKQLGANPKITSIYPTPLVQGNAIKVKVTSPRESSISYSIFDNVGREVGLGSTRQHIGLGDNTIEIGSLDGLANGSYMLKLKFSDGTNDTHFFQVLK